MSATKVENSDKNSNKKVQVYREIYPQIYSYTLPSESDHDGWQKVGYTERYDVNERIREQVQTAAINLDYKLLWHASSVDPTNNAFFTDKDLHKFYVKHGIKRSNRQKDNGFGEEWFYFDGTPEKSKELFNDYVTHDYSDTINDDRSYILRPEQEAAVEQALSYASDHQTIDFSNPNPTARALWNAKPRFGKTLAAYDFAKRFGARNVLVITNRPAIANSWYDDYKKFVTGYYFISTADSLKNRPTLSRSDFLNRANQSPDDKQITFLSLQDLKGAKVFGGGYDKLEWVAALNWDLVIIDEAHEGVDTERTDQALNRIKRRFTLHLSGTPFKALANNYFDQENQIFNWTYLDEQKAKQAELANGNDAGPHTDLPDLRLFTYKMSDMISDRMSQGVELDDGRDIAYAFELNDMFSVDKSGRFVHEKEIKTFLNQLTTNTKYPFSTPELRNELKHTFWLVGNRVAAAKAMHRLLKNHPVFGQYEIVLAAGDGRTDADDDTSEEEMQDVGANEKAYDRVKNAIKHHGKTITLSVGQLTTGVTVKEWSAVLMLTDIKSESLYTQAIFRSQNPYKYQDEQGNWHRKQSAYVFDFSPNRVLEVYDKFANSLQAKVANGEVTESERSANVAELLNYFPVIAEDRDGQMVELDAEQVLTFPKAIIAKAIVDRGFVTNLLFKNITNVFNIPQEVVDALNKVKSTKDTGRVETKSSQPINHDPDRKEKLTKRISVNNERLFGSKVYGSQMRAAVQAVVANAEANPAKGELTDRLVEKYNEVVAEPMAVYQQTYSPSKTKLENLKRDQVAKVRAIAEEFIDKDLTNPNVSLSLADKMADLVEKELPKDTVEREEIDNYNEQEQDEFDQIRSKLRTFARAIPSFVMASDNVDEITLDNIENTVSDGDFEELFSERGSAPFTKDDFRMLRSPKDYLPNCPGEIADGFFDRYKFNAAIREFEERRQAVADYLRPDTTEDIFSYIRPLRTNQIFTPRRVVNLMLDKLEANNPGIFSIPNITFCDLYVKSGLFLTEMAKRLYRGLANIYPDRNQRIKHILEKQLYGFAPSEIIYHIAKKYIYGNFTHVDTSNLKFQDLTEPFRKGDTMGLKFDVVVGNPPYQEMNDNNKMSRSIYPDFFRASCKIGGRISLIMPARWMSGENGPYRETQGFVDEFLDGSHVKSFSLYPNSADLFTGVDIKGGVCFFLYDKEYSEDMVHYTFVEDGKSISDDVPLRVADNIIIRLPELVSILEKSRNASNNSMRTLVSSWNPFGFVSDLFTKNNEHVSRISEVKESESDWLVHGLLKGKRVVRYIPNDELKKNRQGAERWKVFLPRANGSGVFGEVFSTPMIGTPMIGTPMSICTDTFLQVGEFSSELEATNLLKYIKTKYFRAMVGIKKTAVFNYRDCFMFVPLQDFTANSDIDWSQSIDDIDKQLYRKYGLSQQEIDFIEQHVKPME